MQVEVRNVIIITTGKEEAQAAIFEVVDVYIISKLLAELKSIFSTKLQLIISSPYTIATYHGKL